MSESVPLAIVMSVTALLALRFKSRPLLDTVHTVGILCELLALDVLCSSIVSRTLLLYCLRKAPYGTLLNLAEFPTEKDLSTVDELSRYSKEAIQYVLFQ